MSTKDKNILLVAAAVFAAKGNEAINSVGVTSTGYCVLSQAEAQRYIDRKKLKGAVAYNVTREECAAEIAELQGQPPPAAEPKKEDGPVKEPLYVSPNGKECFTNADLKALVKERNLEVADNKNATLIAALEAADLAAEEPVKEPAADDVVNNTNEDDQPQTEA